jgi:hypothetical protein
MSQPLPILYKRTKKGQIQQWQIVIEDNSFYTIEGIMGGAQTRSKPTFCHGKNIGKSNQSEPDEQAYVEAIAKHDKKLKSKYYLDVKDIDNDSFFEPALCEKYVEFFEKIDFSQGVALEGKLNGCLSGDTLIKIKGKNKYLTIKEIVENKLEVKVLSYNIKKKRNEYKDISNWMKNGIDIKENDIKWYEIELANGKKIKATGNHLVYLPKLSCWRRVDELNENDEVLELI